MLSDSLRYFSQLPQSDKEAIIKEYIKEYPNFTLITKSDHELLLATQSQLQNRLNAITEQYENLKQTKNSSNVMQDCRVIDSLNVILSLPMINYLDEFGKRVENVSMFGESDLKIVKETIMDRVQMLQAPKTQVNE